MATGRDSRQIVRSVYTTQYGSLDYSKLQITQSAQPSGNTKKLDWDQILRKVFDSSTGKLRIVYAA